ncbi:MAG: flavohemoglobin expression-modulating QEGLA motif protein [Legionellales bacterium]|nr:flavohemoglobin expression-modulating QEGLA motif protein [Legionellales bacterium]
MAAFTEGDKRVTPEQEVIRKLSDRLVNAQIPLRILDSIKWNDEIKQDFFKHQAKELPQITPEFYAQRKLNFSPSEKKEEFNLIIRDAQNQLGQYSIITQLIQQRCNDYIKAVDMLKARGTPEFSAISKELYGSPNDAFYLGGPNLSQLGGFLSDILKSLSADLLNVSDQKIYSAQQAIELLEPKLKHYFYDDQQVIVKISDNIVADAAAGADCIKLNRDSYFSERDLKYLEVHEGWVHVGTTLNGSKQPYCTFLAKGSPASTVTQEGLAVITEIFTFSSYPDRMLKLTNRVRAIDRVNQGANFLETYQFFLEQDYSEDEAYNYTVRVFRGSAPELGPFTKDLSYTKGFVLIYNYIRLAVQNGFVNYIPMLFCGKVLINEVKLLAKLAEQGLIANPTYLPPQFSDLSALSSWMSFSLYLNKFDLQAMVNQYNFI